MTNSPFSWHDYILEVKGQGHILIPVCGDEDIHVDAGASKSIFNQLFLQVWALVMGGQPAWSIKSAASLSSSRKAESQRWFTGRRQFFEFHSVLWQCCLWRDGCLACKKSAAGSCFGNPAQRCLKSREEHQLNEVWH